MNTRTININSALRLVRNYSNCLHCGNAVSVNDAITAIKAQQDTHLIYSWADSQGINISTSEWLPHEGRYESAIYTFTK
jgi:hypothetical protein